MSASSLRIERMTSDRVEEVLAIHRSAFNGKPTTLLGDRYGRRYLGWYLNREGAFADIAIDPESAAVVGYVLGVVEAGVPALMRASTPWAVLGLATHPWVLLHRRVRLAALRSAIAILGGKLQGHHGPHEVPGVKLFLAAIGVGHGVQRRGVGRALVQAFEGHALEVGAGSVQLFVYASNLPARRLYTACGWLTASDPAHDETMIYYKLMNEQK